MTAHFPTAAGVSEWANHPLQTLAHGHARQNAIADLEADTGTIPTYAAYSATVNQTTLLTLETLDRLTSQYAGGVK